MGEELLGLTCVGFKNGKYQIKEPDPDVKLEFIGEDASKFEQVDVPTDPSNRVAFGLTERYLMEKFPGFLNHDAVRMLCPKCLTEMKRSAVGLCFTTFLYLCKNKKCSHWEHRRN
jgi:hypothetical protein